MKLVIHEQNQVTRTFEVSKVNNGLRVVTDNGVFRLKPLADTSGRMIDTATELPDFSLLNVIRLRDEPDGSGYNLTSEEFGMVILAQINAPSMGRTCRFRALFYFGEAETKWFLEDFQQVAPLAGELVAHGSEITAIAAEVKALTARKAKRDRKTYSQAAKAKAKWFGHEKELSEMANYARKFLKRDAQGQVFRGNWDTVIKEGKGWWKREDFAAPELRGFLDGKNKQWLRRIILKDWREEKRRLD